MKISIGIIEETAQKVMFDFLIDDIPLAEMLGINRISDMRFCDFDLDIFETDKERFPDYDRKKIIRQKINEFTGINQPFNQFGSGRLVLYRCHCGCDYCGVISFKVEINEDCVNWTDIRFELDDEISDEAVTAIPIIQFGRKQYMDVFKNFAERYNV